MVAEHLKAIPIVKDKKLLGMVERKNILKQLYNEYGENTLCIKALSNMRQRFFSS